MIYKKLEFSIFNITFSLLDIITEGEFIPVKVLDSIITEISSLLLEI